VNDIAHPVPTDVERLALLRPSLDRLPGYVDALERGWQPDESRDIRQETLFSAQFDPAGFVANLLESSGTFVTMDGRSMPRIPFRMYWIDDGDFAGTINLRWQPGTLDLPPYVSGHIGYSIVPWKRRRGYAKRALRLILDDAREIGLSRVLVTCDHDNWISRRVIEATGGRLAGTAPHHWNPLKVKILFWIEAPPGPPG
jgi:predicted acetyltransferase